MFDARQAELEAEFFADFDYPRSLYSALDPEFEIACDDMLEQEYREWLAAGNLPVIQPESRGVCPECLNTPF